MESRWEAGRADRRRGPAHTVARGLGWFSIGLGLAECLMPRTMSRVVGLEGKENVLRAFGVREITSGNAGRGICLTYRRWNDDSTDGSAGIDRHQPWR